MACTESLGQDSRLPGRPVFAQPQRLDDLPLPAWRHGAVAQEGGQPAVFAHVLAPRLELPRIAAQRLPETDGRLPEAVRIESRQAHGLERPGFAHFHQRPGQQRVVVAPPLALAPFGEEGGGGRRQRLRRPRFDGGSSCFAPPGVVTTRALAPTWQGPRAAGWAGGPQALRRAPARGCASSRRAFLKAF